VAWALHSDLIPNEVGFTRAFFILVLRTLGFSGLVSQEWASPVWYYNIVPISHSLDAGTKSKSPMPCTVFALAVDSLLIEERSRLNPQIAHSAH
jgi:hypothetical protein